MGCILPILKFCQWNACKVLSSAGHTPVLTAAASLHLGNATLTKMSQILASRRIIVLPFSHYYIRTSLGATGWIQLIASTCAGCRLQEHRKLEFYLTCQNN